MKGNIIKGHKWLSKKLRLKNLRYVFEMYHTYNGMNSLIDRKHFSFRSLLIPISAGAILLAACLINLKTKKPEVILSKQDTALNINTKFLSILSGGHKRLITDLLWIQTLMESDTEHYQKRDLNSWLFLRFNTISILDPQFYQNYAYGGQFLSIVKDDLEGATVIYEKGLKLFPDDYDLNFQAGFMNYYEIGDYKKGYEFLSKVVDNPRAPSFLRSILNKIQLETTGDLNSTYKLVEYNYETTKDTHLKNRLWLDLYAIKAEIDLVCLNRRGLNCDTKDLNGEVYLKNGDQYFSSKSFTKYRIKKRGENKTSPQESLINTIN